MKTISKKRKLPYLKYKDDGRRKLTEEDIKEVNFRRISGERVYKIAEDFKVAPQTIYYWTDKEFRESERKRDRELKRMLKKWKNDPEGCNEAIKKLMRNI